MRDRARRLFVERDSGKHFDRHHFTCRSLFRGAAAGSPTGCRRNEQLFQLKTFYGTSMLIYAGASKKRKKGDAQIERAFSDAPPSMAELGRVMSIFKLILGSRSCARARRSATRLLREIIVSHVFFLFSFYLPDPPFFPLRSSVPGSSRDRLPHFPFPSRHRISRGCRIHRGA